MSTLSKSANEIGDSSSLLRHRHRERAFSAGRQAVGRIGVAARRAARNVERASPEIPDDRDHRLDVAALERVSTEAVRSVRAIAIEATEVGGAERPRRLRGVRAALVEELLEPRTAAE